MKRIILLFFSFLLFKTSFAQITRNNDVIIGQSTSAAGSGILSSTRFQRVAYLVPASELTAAGITNGSTIGGLGFLFSGTPEVPISGTLKVWLQNTSDVTYSKSTTIAFDAIGGVTDGMTLVRDAGISIQPNEHILDFLFTGGTTSNFNYTGNNLYIAFEYSNPTGTISSAASNVYCNSSTAPTGNANGLRRATSTTAMPTTASSSSAFRPYTRFRFTNTAGTGITNDAAVTQIYTLGLLPMPSSPNHQVQALIKNNGDNTLTNLNVTLTITGANTFNNSKLITSLAPGNSELVTFNGFNPTVAGTNNVRVSVPADAVPVNDTMSVNITTNSNTYSIAYGFTTNASTGATTATEHLVKFNTASTITIDQITSYFNVAGAPFTATIRDASGPGGLPGAIPLWESTAQSTIGGNAANNVSVAPALAVNGNFYIGIRQSGATSVGLLAQQNTEFPMRLNTVYTSTSAVNSLNVFTPGGFNKFFIEARYSSILPITLMSFSGNKSGSINNLTWVTANEQNNKGFELQRSVDGVNFTTISFIASNAANGNSSSQISYKFSDEKPLVGTNYYRLKQIDLDNKFTLSSVVKISGEKVKALTFAGIYPNPADKFLNVTIDAPAKDNANLIITDITGRQVMNKSLKVEAGNNLFNLDVSNFSTGTYSIKVVSTDNNETIVSKFMKQ